MKVAIEISIYDDHGKIRQIIGSPLTTPTDVLAGNFVRDLMLLEVNLQEHANGHGEFSFDETSSGIEIRLADIQDARLSKLDQHVGRNLANSISLSSAARIAGLSAPYLSSLFRRNLGITFSRWLTQIRITAANPLLQKPMPQISVIACRVGYPSLNTFERAFRRVEGISPRDYRHIYAVEVTQRSDER